MLYTSVNFKGVQNPGCAFAQTKLRILKIRLEGINEKQKRLDDLEKTDLFLEKDMELLNKHVDILKESVFELKKFESIFNFGRNFHRIPIIKTALPSATKVFLKK